MAFITPALGFCLSPSGVTVFPTCGDIIEESRKQYIWTEDGRNLLVDGTCSDPALPSFSCSQIDRKVADSGSFVTIVNTCTLPLTITGFKNSDSARFSIFEYPKYVGQSLYESGNTSQLPITLTPFEQTNIPTFFPPPCGASWNTERPEPSTLGTGTNSEPHSIYIQDSPYLIAQAVTPSATHRLLLRGNLYVKKRRIYPCWLVMKILPLPT